MLAPLCAHQKEVYFFPVIHEYLSQISLFNFLLGLSEVFRVAKGIKRMSIRGIRRRRSSSSGDDQDVECANEAKKRRDWFSLQVFFVSLNFGEKYSIKFPFIFVFYSKVKEILFAWLTNWIPWRLPPSWSTWQLRWRLQRICVVKRMTIKHLKSDFIFINF